MNTIKNIEANLGDWSRVYNIVKERAEKEPLPADGKITHLSEQEAIDLLKQRSENAPDCSRLGYLKHIMLDVLKSQNLDRKIKKKLIIKAINQRITRSDMPRLLDSFTSEELVDLGVSKIMSKVLNAATRSTPYMTLVQIQKAVEAGRDAYSEHSAQCTRFKAGNDLILQGTKEVIGTITYKTPETPSDEAVKAPVMPLPAALPLTIMPVKLSLPQTNYEKITYKLPPQPEINTTPLPPLNLNSQLQCSYIDKINGHASISISPLKPKQVEVSAGAMVDGISVGVGADVLLNKPLRSKVIINLPITEAPIPLCIKVNGQLNQLHKMQFKLEVPLDPIDKLVSVVGIKCPASLPIVSIKVKHVVKKIKKLFGKTKKHKQKKKATFELSRTITHKVSYVDSPENTPISPELIAACKKIADDLKQMDAATQQLAYEVNIAVQGTKDLEEELEELYASQVDLQKDFDTVQAAFNAQKNLLSALPAIQAQAAENQQQLNNLTAVMQANLTPDRIHQLRNKFSPEEAARIIAQAKAIAELNQ